MISKGGFIEPGNINANYAAATLESFLASIPIRNHMRLLGGLSRRLVFGGFASDDFVERGEPARRVGDGTRGPGAGRCRGPGGIPFTLAAVPLHRPRHAK
jgi:hypothetical protein